MKNIILTEESYEIVVSTLINSKIEAEKNNKNDVNGGYIEAIRKALEELKENIYGKKYIFNTIDSELKKYNGTKVNVIRFLTDNECDTKDVGNMYKVQFKDGYEKDVFEDELSF